MIDALPDWAQAVLFVGLVVLWARLIWDVLRWLWRLITDDGMM